MEVKPYKSGGIRFFQLFLISFVMFGNQYAFNNPQALEQSFETDLGIHETKFDLLYTIFALPNIFATFIIGFLIDKLGVRIGIVALSSGVTFFQLIVAIGGYTSSYITILMGRMFFGIASESLVTAQASMTSFWFKGKQLAFALGNAFNSWLSPVIYELTLNLGTPLMVSVGICTLSTICAVAAAYIDKKAQQYDLQHSIKAQNWTAEGSQPQEGESEQIKCSDIKQLKGSFWLIVTLCMFAVAMYVPFMDGANRLFIKRFCFTQRQAGKALMITYIVAFVCSAPLGILIDKVGFKRYFIIGTMVIFVIAQSIFLFFPQCDGTNILQGGQFGLALLGLGYSFYANCLIPSVPLVVKKKVTGTAFGIMQMIQSIALALFPLIAGVIVQKSSTTAIGYRHSSLFFVVMGLIGLLTSLGLLFVNDRTKRKLDAKSKIKQKDGNTQSLIGQSYKSQSSSHQISGSEKEQSDKVQDEENKKKRFTLQL